MQTTDLPPVEGGFEAPTPGAPRTEAGIQDVQGVTPGAAAPIDRARSPRQAAEASTTEAVKITPTRLREVAYQLELAQKHQGKALDLLASMTTGKQGAVVSNLVTQAEAIQAGNFDETRQQLGALADDLASL